MEVKTKVKDSLIIALDVSTEKELLLLLDELYEHVGYFKVGLELFTAFGSKILDEIKKRGNKIFFDGKFLDIPNTVSKALSNMVTHRVDLINVHILGATPQMLQEAKSSIIQTSSNCKNLNPPKLLGVTILTSTSENILKDSFKIDIPLEDYILHLASYGLENGIDGVVCSPNESNKIKQMALSKNKKDFLIVTPGVRPSWAEANDQKRITTPKEAIKNGSTHLVVGRPITGNKSPKNAAKKILEEIEEAINS